MFEVVSPKGFAVILAYLNFQGRLVHYWSVFYSLMIGHIFGTKGFSGIVFILFLIHWKSSFRLY